MVKGYEYREGVQDPNLNTKDSGVQPNPLPMAPVKSPRPSSMAAVGSGSRDIAALFTKGSGLMQKYFDKKKASWRLEGQMDYAAGKTEQEIRSQGNKYTAEGYSVLKIQTAANEWYTSKINNPEDVGKSTEQFKDELMQGFDGLNSDMKDDFEKEHLAALAGEMFPKLVTNHIQANNRFQEEQSKIAVRDALKSKALLEKRTLRDYQRNLVSASDSENTQQLKELMQMDIANLTPEQKQDAIADAIKASMAAGDASLLNAYANVQKTIYGTNLDPNKEVTEERLFNKLVRLGQTPAKAAGIVNSFKKLQVKEDNEYSRQKIMDEEQIRYDAENSGNLEQALINAEQIAKERGYSDKWLLARKTSILSAVKRGEIKREKYDNIKYRVSTNTLGTTSTEDQQKGINYKKHLLSQEAIEAGIPEESQEGYVREGLMDFYVKNDVMDEQLVAHVSSGLSGNILDKKTNTISQEALSAYQEYMLYDRASGNVGAMLKHLPKDVQSVVLLAQTFDDKTASSFALQQAYSTLQEEKATSISGKQKGTGIPDKILKAEINNIIRDELVPGFWRAYGLNVPFTAKHEGSTVFDFREEDIKNAVETQSYQNYVQSKYKSNYRQNRTTMSESTASKLARKQTFTSLVNNSEYVMGTMVYTPANGVPLSQRMGIGNAKNSANAAVKLYTSTFGKEVWGDEFTIATPGIAGVPGIDVKADTLLYKGIKALGLEDIDVKTSDTPYMNIQYSPDSGTMNVRPYRDIHKTAVSNVPLVIPVERIGILYNAYITGNDELFNAAINAERALLSEETNLYPKE